MVGPPGWNGPKGPLSDVSHAKATIGLVGSEDVDTSENLSPTRGEEGNHRKDATGGALSLYVAAGDASSARNGPVGISPSAPVRNARLATPSDAALDVRACTVFRIHPYPKAIGRNPPAGASGSATEGSARRAAARGVNDPQAAVAALAEAQPFGVHSGFLGTPAHGFGIVSCAGGAGCPSCARACACALSSRM